MQSNALILLALIRRRICFELLEGGSRYGVVGDGDLYALPCPVVDDSDCVFGTLGQRIRRIGSTHIDEDDRGRKL